MNMLKRDSNPLQYVIPREQPMRWRRRILWALPLLLVAAIPLVKYIEVADDRLGFMLLMLIGTHIMVDLRVLLRANEIGARLRQMTGNLDLLILTGMDAKRLVYKQWWLVLRHTWTNALPLIVLRLGTALAFAQYLERSLQPSGFWVYFKEFTTQSAIFQPFNYLGLIARTVHYPMMTQVLLGVVVIAILTYGEVFLISAIGICLNFWNGNRRRLLLVFQVAIRAMLIGVMLVLIPHLNQTIKQRLYDPTVMSENFCYDSDGNYRPLPNSMYSQGICEILIRHHDERRVLDTLQVAIWSSVDSGTLLAANLMRPGLSYDFKIDRLDFFYAPGLTPQRRQNISAWRFIARMLAAAGLTMLLHMLLTYGFLFSARRRLTW